MKRTIIAGAVFGTVAALALPILPANAAVKANQNCKKVGEVKDGLTCTAVGKKRVYRPAAAAPTTAAPVAGAAAAPAPVAAGLANAPGFDGKTIKVAVFGNVSVNTQFPASASFADGGKALYAGWLATVRRVNDAGGIGGKYKIEPVFKETYYTPSEAIKAYAESKNSSAVIGMIYGTPLTQALEKELAQDNIVGSPISLDAAWVKSSHILPVGATYQAQAMNLLEWYTKDGGGAGKTVCSIALANNAYGNAGEEGFDIGAKALGLKVGTKIKTSTAPAQAAALKEAKCDAVVATISGEAQTPPLLSETAKLDYFPTILALGPSFATRSVVPANSAQFSKQVFVASDNSQWGVETNAGMKQHVADLKKYAPEQIGNPNPATIWGAAQASSVIALLEKAVAGNDLSRVGIKKALDTLGPVKLGGMFPEWDYGTPANRKPPAASNIYKVDISVPGGLELIKANFASAAATAFKP
jgi:Periplasmic binding protein